MKNRLFIFEGPDAVGKTTLAIHLARHIKGLVWHMTCTKLLAPAMKDYQLNAIENARENLPAMSVVFDRLWPSEICYGNVLRPASMVNLTPVRMETSKLDPVYVFCLDEKGAESAADRHESMQDPAHPYDRETYLQIYAEYEKLVAHLKGQPGHNVEVRYFDSRIVDMPAVHQYNFGFCEALRQKYLNSVSVNPNF
jgi:thymidylate kinase